jgi:predicted acetyltransferase
VDGWGRRSGGGVDIPFFLRKGPFLWAKLPLELKAAVVETTMKLDRQTAYNLFAVSKEVWELATFVHIKSHGLTIKMMSDMP